jgi:2,4-dienoyl-CoA reductase-like NADH-dependent reductase (Old Yellow Enzyme family)
MSALDRVFEPVRIGPVTAPNRIYVPAHFVGLAPEAQGAYLAARARGGAGLVVIAGGFVHRSWAMPGIMPWHREWVPEAAKIIAPIQAEGAPAIVQLVHPGVNIASPTGSLDVWGPLWGPSDIASAAFRVTPKVVEQDDIEELVEGFATVAAHVQEAGGAGVELHGAHGYLLSAFLSPYWNRRTDLYGGDTQRRARLALEIGRAVRARCGEGFVVGLKINWDEYLGEAGTTPDEALRVLEIAAAANLFDYFCLSHTDYHNNHLLIPPASSGETTPLAHGGAAARRALGGRVPVLVQGSVRDVETAAAIVARGEADMVGMARAHIADAEIVNKARAGRSPETRRCVGANQGCWRRLYQPVSCTVNPATGREAQWSAALAAPRARRNVLVVGGGPAGLKAAETAALLGHRVTLWEAGKALGGQLLAAAELPDWDNWRALVEDLAGSLARLGATVELDRQADADGVAAFGADDVIVATGAKWETSGFSTFRTDRDGIPRAEGARVLDAETAILQPERCGARVVIVDDNGDYTAIGLARMLRASGREATIVTLDARPGRTLDATNDFPWVYPRALAEGVHVEGSSFVERIEADRVLLSDRWTGATRGVVADSVVLCMRRVARAGLHDALRARGVPATRVGDCLAPREVDDAVLEGFRCALAIGLEASGRAA